MPDDRHQFFSSAAMRVLLVRELAALTSIVAGVYGNHGLFLRAHAAERIALPQHLLGNMIELAPNARGEFEGTLKCVPSSLPFVSESFKLLIVQHVLEQIADADACAAELARVLAPEGVALVFGFNPLGTWRPWLAWQRARGGPPLHLRSAQAWRMQLSREQIDTLQVRFPGSLWPRAAMQQAPNALSARLARCGSSWLLLARKRRSTLTPLRLRQPARELALNPRLAPGAQRARA